MNYKGIEIRRKPWWTIFYMPRAHAFTMLGRVYVNKKIYNEVLSNKITVETEATLEHELTHIKRFIKVGIWKSEIIYWLSKEFRYKEEQEAIKSQMKILKKHKHKYDIEKASKSLSSFDYLWCVDYKTVKRDLNRIWNEI